MRILLLIVGSFLTGCAGEAQRQLPTYYPPGPVEVAQGLTLAATQAALAEPLMASPVKEGRMTAPGAPGVFIACVKSATPDRARSPQAVYFKEGKYLSSRLALGADGCHRELFTQFQKVELPSTGFPKP